MAEKRKYRRLSLERLPCRVFQEGQLVDLSIGGAFVATERPLPHGSVVTIEAHLPRERTTIRARAKVEWTGDYYHGASAKRLLGMGVSFIEIEPADRIAISRFLAATYEATRAARHVSASIPARIRNGTRWVSGVVRELGERSLFLETSVVEAVGNEVQILLRFPSARAPVEARGVVLAAVSPKDADEAPIPGPLDVLRGLKIELSEVGLRARELLTAFLKEAREAAAEGPE